jgi:hypothetical protein
MKYLEKFKKFLGKKKNTLIFQSTVFIGMLLTGTSETRTLLAIFALLMILVEFVVWLNEGDGEISASSEVVFAKNVTASTWENIGRFFVTLSCISGAPTRKALNDNLSELAKTMNVEKQVVKNTFSEIHKTVAEYHEKSMNPDEKIGFKKD